MFLPSARLRRRVVCTDTHGSRVVVNDLASTYLLPVIDVGVQAGAKRNGDLAALAADVRILDPNDSMPLVPRHDLRGNHSRGESAAGRAQQVEAGGVPRGLRWGASSERGGADSARIRAGHVRSARAPIIRRRCLSARLHVRRPDGRQHADAAHGSTPHLPVSVARWRRGHRPPGTAAGLGSLTHKRRSLAPCDAPPELCRGLRISALHSRSRPPRSGRCDGSRLPISCLPPAGAGLRRRPRAPQAPQGRQDRSRRTRAASLQAPPEVADDGRVGSDGAPIPSYLASIFSVRLPA